MLINNQTIANDPLVGFDSINPQFFGAVTETSATETQSFWITPEPVRQAITVQPAPVVQNGVIVEFSPFTQEVSVQAPAKEVVVHIGGVAMTKNAFESVGIVKGTNNRLCALVRPNVVAAARHFNLPPYVPYIGRVVRFVGATNTEEATITKVAFTRGDFECYYLDRAITAVKPAEIALLEAASAYLNREIVVFGLSGLSRPVAAKTNLRYAFGQGGGLWSATGGNRAGSALVIQNGDSGSPCYIVTGGVPRYLGSMAAVNLSVFSVNMASPWSDAISAL